MYCTPRVSYQRYLIHFQLPSFPNVTYQRVQLEKVVSNITDQEEWIPTAVDEAVRRGDAVVLGPDYMKVARLDRKKKGAGKKGRRGARSEAQEGGPEGGA